ncbi:hypothetical protein AYO38_01670 [bacterium SCGC AG-212-C10]|nr:hypothetical protein AYO38_01670 [bacterium SCGC AG-212-C10]
MTETIGPVHLIGVGGMHMSAIAQLLLQQGIPVSGSDIRASALTERVEAMGGRVFIGEHDAANVGDAASLVYTAAVGEENPELAEARRRGIPAILRAEMVARLMEGKRVIAVAGSHGKTTTSSLIAFALKEAGMDPMYLLGGESLDLGGNASWGNGPICVVEADEYRRAFHEYTPDVAVITNIEADHLDVYGTEEAYFEAFVEFARKIKPGGRLIICDDDPGADRLVTELSGTTFEVQTYGLAPRDHWMAGNPQQNANGVSFEVLRQGTRVGDLHLKRPGMHVVRNALAAAAVCLQEGVEFSDLRSSAAKFDGAARRFEYKGDAGGVVVMDDYAHHPTEVRTILEAARARFGNRRIIGVYQPHTYSRIAYLWDDWTTCWSGLDALIVVETYAAREQPLPGKSAADLARAIRQPSASYAADFEIAAKMAADTAKAGDVIFTIGAGDVTELGPRILELLSER